MKKIGAIGHKWGKMTKENENAIPSPKDLLLGLQAWTQSQLESSPEVLEKIKERQINDDDLIDSAILYEKIFNKIREILNLEDITKPMNTRNRDDYDLLNPYGKMTCLILNLFSMEFGVPPLYAEVNRVCRVRDMKHI